MSKPKMRPVKAWACVFDDGSFSTFTRRNLAVEWRNTSMFREGARVVKLVEVKGLTKDEAQGEANGYHANDLRYRARRIAV